MHKFAFACAAALPALAFSTEARADCGSLTIESMNWQSTKVLTPVSGDFAVTTDPAAVDCLKKRVGPNAAVNALTAGMIGNHAAGTDAVRGFLKTHPEARTARVTPKAAENAKAAL